MYDPLYTGYMPDIYGTTQLFACSDKYAEHLIGHPDTTSPAFSPWRNA